MIKYIVCTTIEINLYNTPVILIQTILFRRQPVAIIITYNNRISEYNLKIGLQ